MPELFDPLPIRGLKLPNRIAVSPMCQYSSVDGYANDWHLVHLGSRAVGGAALVFTEASAVVPEGRISPQDLGIWSDGHVEFLSRIVKFLHGQGARSGIQLAHAGRKGSTYRPWAGREGAIPSEEGGWEVVAPSPIKFAPNYPQPRALAAEEIQETIQAFARAAGRALRAGFKVVEIHAAHGYLIHEFLSPLSNQRRDEYGGSFENRTRLLRQLVSAIRGVIPDSMPLFVRISSTDWKEGGWDIEQSVELARILKPSGVDLIDCSSGGNVADAKIPLGPGYQVPFAERIRREAGILTAAVGMITHAKQADEVVSTGRADLVLIAREFLRDPCLALHAAAALERETTWPVQYLRAAPPGSNPRTPIA
jgi:2,4-dienoyl-CoA reductase-like NADH-dependent reductase (Old Yellow Enzyme family)